MRQISAKKESGSLIDKALSINDDIYAYLNSRHNIVVLFTMPPFSEVERLMSMCGYGIISSNEVEDYLWDKYVVESSILPNETIKLDGTKVAIADVIARSNTLTSFEDIVTKLNVIPVSYTETLGTFVKDWDKNITDNDLKKMDLSKFLLKISNELGTRNKSPEEFVDLITGKTQPTQKGQAPQQQAQPQEQLTVKDVIAPPGQDVLEAKTFTKIDDPSQARVNPAFSDVFKKLDYISKKGMSQEEINEKINPTQDLGDGLSMIGGKLIDENAPRKKIDKKKIKSRRVIG